LVAKFLFLDTGNGTCWGPSPESCGSSERISFIRMGSVTTSSCLKLPSWCLPKDGVWPFLTLCSIYEQYPSCKMFIRWQQLYFDNLTYLELLCLTYAKIINRDKTTIGMIYVFVIMSSSIISIIILNFKF
jgi:hypothetical protein